MPTDRDTLARDLLTLPALVGAPWEVVRGLCLRDEAGQPWSITLVEGSRWVLFLDHVWIEDQPAALARDGWRVDLDAPATAGVLLGLLGPALRSVTRERDGWRVGLWLPDARISDHTAPVLGEAAARALVEVARGR